MDKKYFILIMLIILMILVIILFPLLNNNARTQEYTPLSEISKLYQKGDCCCEFLTDDIQNEELMSALECQNLGRCIEVDPLRLTPHSCCPGATGKTCGSLIE